MNMAGVQTVDQNELIDYMELDSIIEKEFNSDKENLIMMLQAIQKCYNYLPPTGACISCGQNRCSLQQDLWCGHLLQYVQPRTQGPQHCFSLSGHCLSC